MIMTDDQIRLSARIAVLQAWLELQLFNGLRSASNRRAAVEALKADITKAAKAVELSRDLAARDQKELAALDRKKLDDEIVRVTREMLDDIAARLE